VWVCKGDVSVQLASTIELDIHRSTSRRAVFGRRSQKGRVGGMGDGVGWLRMDGLAVCKKVQMGTMLSNGVVPRRIQRP